MPILEELPREEPVENNMDPKLEALLNGPASENYMLRQIQLACEDYLVRHPEEHTGHMSKETRDKLMEAWADSKMSKAFKGIRFSPNFSTHPRLMGKISNINLEDVKYWVENEKLKEN